MEKKIYKHEYFGELYYLVNVPEEYKNKKGAPMLVFLHGSGERGKDFNLIAKNGIPKYINEGMKIPAITVCPQCPENFIWNNYVFLLKDFIEYAAKEYGADTAKISLTGISMGGFGTWEMAMCWPDLFRRIAPICGGGTSWRTDLIKAPVWAFHGDKDQTVLPENSYEMVDALVKQGKDARLTIFHNVGHDSWDDAYLNTKLIDWLTAV